MPADQTDAAQPAPELAPRQMDAAQLAQELAPLLIERLRTEIALGDDAVVDPVEAAAVLRKSPSTLEMWRSRGIGPRSIKTGPRSVGYTIGELRRFIRDAKAAFPAATA
jgi:hypothetical protein